MPGLLRLEEGERTAEADKMSRCKVAERLAERANEEVEKSSSTGYYDDLVLAHNAYLNHIEDHGCWRDKRRWK